MRQERLHPDKGSPFAFITQSADQLTGVDLGHSLANSPSTEPFDIRLSDRARSRSDGPQLDHRLPSARDKNAFPFESTIDQLRQLVLGLSDAIGTHLVEMAI
jgi:hypothetical protein